LFLYEIRGRGDSILGGSKKKKKEINLNGEYSDGNYEIRLCFRQSKPISKYVISITEEI
jgi:hypothetical protein